MQFIHKLSPRMLIYIKGLTKWQCTTIKQAFINNYDDVDDNFYLFPSPENEVETWTPKKEIKKKKTTVFSTFIIWNLLSHFNQKF